MSRPRTCEFWLSTRRQCEESAEGLYHWDRKAFTDGSTSYLAGMGPGPASALCAKHLRQIVGLAGQPDRATGPEPSYLHYEFSYDLAHSASVDLWTLSRLGLGWLR